ncbi:MAG: 5'/3'-nucleotidase SurE [bacterium]|nr:5'/3'-nucleotidase SurE [bacterium]
MSGNEYAVDGTPATCVFLAISGILDERPDLVVSGINDGANVSINVLYSGTVAAAAEGALLGIPAIAVSLERGPELDFDWAARIARGLIERAVDGLLTPGQLLNVNIPNLAAGKPRGVRIVGQSVQKMDEGYERRDGPDGSAQYFLEGYFGDLDDIVETDLKALMAGYVAVTPLHFDLTAREQLGRVADWDWGTLPS